MIVRLVPFEMGGTEFGPVSNVRYVSLKAAIRPIGSSTFKEIALVPDCIMHLKDGNTLVWILPEGKLYNLFVEEE